MSTPDNTQSSFLAAVPGPTGRTAAELVTRIETRLGGTLAALEGLRGEVAALAALAPAPPPPAGAVAPRLLTVRQAATALGVGASTVHQLIRTGDLGSRKIGGSRRIPVADLDAFIARLPDHRIGA
ncbi:MAG: helix-turn-helix domain-containing protein [Actinomycetota bacterium]|nr:helix-turn-helix domain-containing protein [Actinomycetota bacterium]